MSADQPLQLAVLNCTWLTRNDIHKQFTLLLDCITATASLCCSYSTALQCSERCVTRGERLLTSRNGHPVSNRTPPCHSNVVSVEADECYGSGDGCWDPKG